MATVTHAAGVLSFRQLRYLVALAGTLNFTRAARQCFVTQSTLSAAIGELERGLGAVLFERDRRSVRPTALGLELAARARLLLSQAVDFVDRAQTAAHPLQGQVTLGAIPTIAPFLLPRLLRRMRQAMPQLTTFLREDRTGVLLEEVESGAIDFALVALPMELGRLQAHHVCTDALWLIAARDDPLARQRDLHAAQIDLGRLMLLGDGHCLRDHSLQACQSGWRGRQRTPMAVEANSLPTLVQMVEAGLGVSLLPEMAVKAGFLAGTRVVARPLAAPVPRREITLVARPTTSRGPLLERICELAALAGRAGPSADVRRARVRAG
jgi:LysR family hydrogen peroxide-inducible transcriptional activator